MDLSLLAELGKTAGASGVALVMIALIARAVIDRTASLPNPQRARMLRFVGLRAEGAAYRKLQQTSALFALSLLAPSAASGLEDAHVKAGVCAIATAGSAVGNVVTCNLGLTPDQLQQLTSLAAGVGETTISSVEEVVANFCGVATRGGAKDNRINCNIGPTALVEQIKDVSNRLDINEKAALALLRIVGEDPNIPEDKLAGALTKVARDYKKLQAQVAALNPDNAEARQLVEDAKPEIESGHLEHAQELLRQATQLQIAAAQQAYKIEKQGRAAGDAQMLGAAGSTAADGDLAMTARRYTVAAELFGQAAGYVPAGHPSEHYSYLLYQADALYRQGDERGDNDALRSSIEIYERILASVLRPKGPLLWAGLQVNLGNALLVLGERESGTAHLDEAVRAFSGALEEYTRERAPLEWAMTQNAIGNALLLLGEREKGTARLEAAVSAYRAALEEWTRDRVPLDWATTKNNLGNALIRLGQRENGTARLEEAVTAYRAALEERTRERVPLEWAQTQVNLGSALETLGERESATARFEDAVTAFSGALKEYTRDRVPLAWAGTQNAIGNALLGLGELGSGTARLDEAVSAYRAALEEYTRDRVPLAWAGTTGNLGGALMLIAERTNDAAAADEAVQDLKAAFETMESGGDAASSTFFEAHLTRAQALFERLKGQSGK